MGFRVLSVVFAVLLAANYGLTEESLVLADKPKLSIYVTSRCGDTINFITTKFYPVYQELGSELDIQFIPWGKSQRNPDGSITCQFGETDCAANRLQLCALFLIGSDQQKVADYINCEYSTLSSVSMDFTCVKQVGLIEEHAKECYDSALGTELLGLAESKTGTITMVFVPTIVLNDNYDAGNQSAAFNDFRGFVCGILQQTNPNACR